MNYAPTAQAIIEGEQYASAALVQVSTRIAGQDCIYQAMQSMLPQTCDCLTLVSIRGFCRALQKQIERGSK